MGGGIRAPPGPARIWLAGRWLRDLVLRLLRAEVNQPIRGHLVRVRVMVRVRVGRVVRGRTTALGDGEAGARGRARPWAREEAREEGAR